MQVGMLGLKFVVEEDMGGNLEDLSIVENNWRYATKEMAPLLVLSSGSLEGSLRRLHYVVSSTLGRWGNGH